MTSGTGMMGLGGGYGAYDQTDPQAQIKQLETVLDQLQRAKAMLTDPGKNEVRECNEPTLCSYRQVCQALQKNRNAPALYRNSASEEFINYSRVHLEKQINLCLNNSLAQKKALEEGIKTQKQMQKYMSTLQNGYYESMKKLNQSILKNGEAQKYIKVQDAMTTISFEMSKKSDSKYMMPAKWIEQAQKKAGVRLSKETVDAWNKSMGSQMLGGYGAASNYGIGGMPAATVEGVVSTENPFFESQLLVDPNYAGGMDKIKAYQEQFNKQSERAKKLFEEAREHGIEILKAKRNSKNSPNIDILITRLEKLKFAVASHQESSCGSPNGYYQPSSHTVYLCPNKLTEPKGLMLTTLGHEIGHSIDSCQAAYDLRQKHSHQEHGDDNPEDTAKPAAQSRYGLIAAESDAAAKRNLIAAGLPYDEHPLGTVLTCLQNPVKSVGAKLPSVEDKIRTAQEMNSAIVGANGPNDESLEKIPALAKKYASCSGDGEHTSQMGEAFSDWYGAEVVKKAMDQEKDPRRKRELAVEAAMKLASSNCFGVSPELPKKFEQNLAQLGCHLNPRGDNDVHGLDPNATHPPAYKRVNHVLLAIPEVAQTLGCLTTPEKERCE